jgi:hypothetical protein
MFNNTHFNFNRWLGNYSVRFPPHTFPNQPQDETLPFDMDNVKAMPVIERLAAITTKRAKLPAVRGVQKAASSTNTRQRPKPESVKHVSSIETRRGNRSQPSSGSSSSCSKGADATTNLTGAPFDSRKDQGVSPATFQVCAMSGMCYVILLQVVSKKGQTRSGNRSGGLSNADASNDGVHSAVVSTNDQVSPATYQVCAMSLCYLILLQFTSEGSESRRVTRSKGSGDGMSSIPNGADATTVSSTNVEVSPAT